MKRLMKFGSATMLVSMLLISSCGGDDPDAIAETERVKKLLIAGTWHVTTVTVDGMATDVYEGLSVTFTSTTVTALNGDPVWPVSETWMFTNDTAKAIKRGDGLVIDITSITETELKLELTWSKSTLGGGRMTSIAGDHIFTFRH